MFRSMTAFGRALSVNQMCDIAIEIVSVNRKHLDIRCALPAEMGRFEPFLRSLFDGKVERGMIQVKVQIQWKEELPLDLYPNLPLIKKYVEIRKAFGAVSDSVMDWVFNQEGTIVTIENEDKDPLIQRYLSDAFEAAFKQFLEMKVREGKAIYKDLLQRVEILETHLKEIEKRAPDSVLKYREKIGKILSEFTPIPEDKERALKEAAVFADRVDITEEITRFKSHLNQLQKLSDGKTVDFLLQEMMREVNTMGNKAQDADISSNVVVMKAELEKIREQIQNVE